MKEFFILNDPENLPDSQYVEYVDGKIEYAASIKCPKSIGHTRGGPRISKLFVKIPDCCDDMVWTWYSDCLINDKIANLFRRHNVTGYQLEDIVIEKDKRKNISNEKLYELVIKGSAGHISDASGYKVLEVCDLCGSTKIQHFTNGLIINEDTWDKSDLFTVLEYPKFILVTEKVKILLQEHKITGCDFINVVDYKVDW